MIDALDPLDTAGVHGYFAHTPAEVASHVAGRLGVPYGFSVHALDLRKVPAEVMDWRAGKAACVIACNRDAAAEISRSGAKVKLISHGVDIDRFHPTPLTLCEPVRLLVVGRLVEKKVSMF
ncbi:MAG: glycosyltransferase (plasmid) [Candidatus Manganitrophus sp.]|nr:MAG: glycosyltransferase [Candidatus Manganitrophus sp.]